MIFAGRVGFRDVALGCASGHILAISADHKLICWGNGSYGKLGLGDERNRDEPKWNDNFDQHHLIQEIYCGQEFSVALTANGLVLTWGQGVNYRTGHGTLENVACPKVVQKISHKMVVRLSVGSAHVVCLTSDFEFWAWGQLYFGKCSFPEPTKIDHIGMCREFACGGGYTVYWKKPEELAVPMGTPRRPLLVTRELDCLQRLVLLFDSIWEGETNYDCSFQKECLTISIFNMMTILFGQMLHKDFKAGRTLLRKSKYSTRN